MFLVREFLSLRLEDLTPNCRPTHTSTDLTSAKQCRSSGSREQCQRKLFEYKSSIRLTSLTLIVMMRLERRGFQSQSWHLKWHARWFPSIKIKQARCG